MHSNKHRKSAAAALGVIAMASNGAAFAGGWGGSYGNGAPYTAGWQDPYAQRSLDEKIAILRTKVKYVFVIFQENESFDHYFGTYPGANGLFEANRGFTPANQTTSFKQRLLDTALSVQTISPFLMPQAVLATGGNIVPIYPADEISVDHSHQGMANSLRCRSHDRRSPPTTATRWIRKGLTTNANQATS